MHLAALDGKSGVGEVEEAATVGDEGASRLLQAPSGVGGGSTARRRRRLFAQR